MKEIRNVRDLNDANVLLLTKEEPPQEVIQYISETLKENELGDSSLAEMVGVPRQIMERYLKNPKIMPVLVALRISKILNKPVEELVELGEYGWIKRQVLEKNSFAYVRIDTLDIYCKQECRRQIEETGLEYYCPEEQKYLTKKDYIKLMKRDPEEAQRYKYLYAELAMNNKPIFLSE